jgi:hypothetical protein
LPCEFSITALHHGALGPTRTNKACSAHTSASQWQVRSTVVRCNERGSSRRATTRRATARLPREMASSPQHKLGPCACVFLRRNPRHRDRIIDSTDTRSAQNQPTGCSVLLKYTLSILLSSSEKFYPTLASLERRQRKLKQEFANQPKTNCTSQPNEPRI